MSRKTICILVLLCLLLSVAVVVAPAPTPGPSGSGGGSSLSLQSFTNKLQSWQKQSPKQYQSMVKLLGNGDGSKPNPTPPSFVNATVTPNLGNWTDEFTYVARIKSINDSEATLRLDVFIPSTKSWKSLDDKEVRSYMYKDHIASVRWKFQDFAPDDAGNSSKFRIYYYDQNSNPVPLSPELVGPKNIAKQILNLSCRVTPENGTCKNMYNYSVQVYNPSRGRMKVALEVLLPGNGEWYPVGEKLLYPSRYDRNNTVNLSWNVRPFTKDDVNKSSSFRISYEDDRQNSDTIVEDGPWLENNPPKILTTWVEPPQGTSRQSFTYHAVVRDIDSDDLQANLVIYDPKRGEILTKMSQGVRGSDASNQNGSELIWPYKFAESYENRSFEYDVTVSDGAVETATGNRSGPNMLALPTITVDVLPPESQNNNWWDEYNFKVRVDNPSTQIARFTPAISTSKGWSYLDSWNVSQTSGPETHEWQFSKFTPNDRNKPISYEVRYTLPDQYGTFNWTSQNQNEKRISDVMMSGLPMAINLVWIGLLGIAAYLSAGRLSQLFSKIGGKRS
jgi:hypothetical protein